MDFFLGGIIQFGGNFAPRDWAFCHGQIVSINQNQALYAILGTIWGGDGRTSFALPDLRGRVPSGFGQGYGLSNVFMGQKFGQEICILSLAQMPVHSHSAIFQGTGGLVENPISATGKLKVATNGTEQKTATSNSDAINADGISIGPSSANLYRADATTYQELDCVDVTVSGNSGGITGGTVSIDNNGGSQPFSIMQPTLGVNFIICLEGVFPSRN